MAKSKTLAEIRAEKARLDAEEKTLIAAAAADLAEWIGGAALIGLAKNRQTFNF